MTKEYVLETYLRVLIGYVYLIDGKSMCMCVERTCVFERRKVKF